MLTFCVGASYNQAECSPDSKQTHANLLNEDKIHAHVQQSHSPEMFKTLTQYMMKSGPDNVVLLDVNMQCQFIIL